MLGLKIFWAGLIILFVIVESLTFSLISIWLAAGAIFGLIFAMLEFPLIWQIAIFTITSAIFLIFTKPFVKKYLKIGLEKTNVDSIIGQTGLVKKKINVHDSGLVKVSGQMWTAISFNNEIIEENEEVIIMAVEGVKLIVKRRN